MRSGNLKLVSKEEPEEPAESGKCPVCNMPLDECQCCEVEYITYDQYITHLEAENEELARAILAYKAERDVLRQIVDRLLDGQMETM